MLECRLDADGQVSSSERRSHVVDYPNDISGADHTCHTLVTKRYYFLVLVVIHDAKEGLDERCFKRELEDRTGKLSKVEATLSVGELTYCS